MATEEGVIDTMTFRAASDGPVSKGSISNKTAAIALFYSDRAEASNIKELDDLKYDLQTAELQMSRIRHYNIATR